MWMRVKRNSTNLLLVTWCILFIIVATGYWNEKEANNTRERHLLKELRRNSELMAETSQMRPLWKQLLKELKENQAAILVEIAEAKKTRDEYFKMQEQKIDKIINKGEKHE